MLDESAQAPGGTEGFYRAFPLAWTVEESTKEGSKSVCIVYQFAIHSKWVPDPNIESGGQWSGEFAPGWFVYGRTYVVGSDGKLNPNRVQDLIQAGVWGGDFMEIREGNPPPNVWVIIEVGANEYGGKKSYRADWIHPNSDVPKTRAGFKPAEESLLQSLRARFGGEVRAVGGGKPAGRAPAPPGAVAAPQPAVQPAVQQPQQQPAAPPVPQHQPAQQPPPQQAQPPMRMPPPGGAPRTNGPPPIQPATGGAQQMRPPTPGQPPQQPPAGFGDPADPGAAGFSEKPPF